MQAGDITASWLNRVLARQRRDAEITGCKLEDIGAGTGFGGTVLRARLQYDRPTDAPAVLVVKLPTRDERTLQAVKVRGALLREARFYRELAPAIDVITPKIHHVEMTGEDFAIVMEDLGDIRPDTPPSMSLADLKLALEAVAKLHAAFWNHPMTRRAWLASLADGDGRARADNAVRLDEAIRILEASACECGQVLECARRLRKLLPKTPAKVPLPRPVTLVHGDYHGANLHISEGRVTVFDWQLVARGTPAMDVANLVVSSAEPAAYDGMIEELLRTYHKALLANGVRRYPLRKLRRGYRDALFFTLVKFLIVLGTIDYDAGGEDMKAQVIPRLDAAAINAGALDYCKRLPLLFMIMRVVNFFRGAGA